MKRQSIAECEAFKKIGEPEEPTFIIGDLTYPQAMRYFIPDQPFVLSYMEPEPAVRPILKLILRQATYFLLLMLAIGVVLAVFL